MMHDVDYEGNTPLLLAVEGGCAEITRHLLEYDSDVNHYNMSRIQPLHIACTIGSLEIVKILIAVSIILNILSHLLSLFIIKLLYLS